MTWEHTDKVSGTCFGGEWVWYNRGYSARTPAQSVYCSECEQLLFSIIYDAAQKQHKIRVPTFHSIHFQQKVLDLFKDKFPFDTVVIVTSGPEVRFFEQIR